MRRTKVFNFFTLGFTNFAIFVSLIVGAQDYFLGTISLGVLMLINSSFNSVQTACCLCSCRRSLTFLLAHSKKR
jgi:ABC-type uncharacterized transport system fused permease/ATPase subunit